MTPQLPPDPQASRLKILNMRNVPEETVRLMKSQAARQGQPLGLYLAGAIRLVELLQRESGKSSRRARQARAWLVAAGLLLS